jgi:hypothetical protein
MLIKEIQIPSNHSLPDDFDSFSPEENECLLIAGYQYLKSIKDGIFENPKNKIEDKIKEYFRVSLEEKEKKIEDLESINQYTKRIYDDMLVREREHIKKEIFEMTSKEMEKIKQLLEEERVRSKEIEMENVRLEEKTKHSLDSVILLQMKEMEMRFLREKEEISLEKAKITEEFHHYKIRILEKEKEEMSVHQKNAVAKNRGNTGEDVLFDLLQRTFSSLNCYIENTSGSNHKGDFHLKFEKFTILVDCKNYIDSRNVNVESRKQIKHDLEQNRHIKIAWLISLNKPISRYGGVPWQFDLEDGICCFYINELLIHSSPEDTLKMVWKASCILYNILDTNSETSELTRLKEYELKVKQIYERLKNLSKQRHNILLQSIENMNLLKNNFIETEKTDIELINQNIMSIHDLYKDTIREWWNANIIEKEGNKLKTDNLYNVFTENDENKRIDKEVFRDILSTFVKEEEITKGKQAKTQYTIMNYAWKS